MMRPYSTKKALFFRKRKKNKVKNVYMVCSIYHSGRLAKKVILFAEIGWVKMFLSLTSPISQICIRIYISNLKKKRQKETKEESISGKSNSIPWYCLWMCSVYFFNLLDWVMTVENLKGYNDNACECALCTFNLLDWVISFSWIQCSLCAMR